MLEANLIVNHGSYCNDEVIERLIRYIYKQNSELVFGYGFWPQTIENAITSFENLRQMSPATSSSQNMQHIQISFGPLKDLALVNQYSNEIARLFLPYPICFASHTDTDHIHTHFAVSTTSLFPNQQPLIGSLWETYLKKILDFSPALGIRLHRKDKYNV